MNRDELETKHGQVWSTAQLTDQFSVLSFCYGLVNVTRRSDNARGTLHFQHRPRFYFAFSATEVGNG